jgi:biopolymer transport protein TolR
MGMTPVQNKGQFSDPNIVPLIDVLLVLIIIFMMITPRVPTGLPTLVPQSSRDTKTISPSDTIVVQVLDGGKLMVNDQASSWNTLGTQLSTIFRVRADKVAFVKGSEEVSFSQVTRAIDVMRGAGIEHIGLMTSAGNTQ